MLYLSCTVSLLYHTDKTASEYRNAMRTFLLLRFICGLLQQSFSSFLFQLSLCHSLTSFLLNKATLSNAAARHLACLPLA